MRKQVSIKHVLVIGIVSLLMTGIILSSNWNYFIHNNDQNNTSLSSYQITTSNNYKNYGNESQNIIFQINILKSAVEKNNFMYQKYNNVFEHNINYTRMQKSSIKNKIDQANLSIKHELDILNTMRNIIHNHPYNYLKFFQSNNYTIPKIVYQANSLITSSINNIETYTSNKKESDSNVNSIAYQSEEATIGIGGISSLILGSNKLIFSKTNFNYNNIFYFSDNSNSLTTLNEFKNTLNQTTSKDTTTQNQFINSGKINKDIKKVGKNNTLSFAKAFSYLSFMGNKHSLIIGGYVGGAALISAGAGIGYFVYRYKKIVNKFKTDGTSAKVDPNSPFNSLSSNSGALFQNNYIPSRNNPVGEVVNPKRVAIESNEVEHNEITALGKIEIEKEIKNRRWQAEYDEFVAKVDLLNKNRKTYLKEERTKLPNFSLDVMNDDSFFRKLYTKSNDKESVPYESFKSIVTSFLYQSDLKDLKYTNYGGWIRNITNAFIATIPYTKSKNVQNNREILRRITTTSPNYEEYEISDNKTLNGWLNLPTFDSRLDRASLSKDDLQFIQNQLQKFKEVKNSMKKGISPSELFSLLKETSARQKDYSPTLHLLKNEQFVLNELTNDIHEVLDTYINHLTLAQGSDVAGTSLEESNNSISNDVSDISDSVIPETIDVNAPAKLNTRAENYFEKFEASRLIKTRHGGVSNSGVSAEEVLADLKDAGYVL